MLFLLCFAPAALAAWGSWAALGAAPGTGGGSGEIAGATTSHWAFQPVQRPPVPAVKRVEWVQSPIDAFLLAKLEEKNLVPAAPADRRTLLRRVSYDLTGLPPTPEEMDAFVGDSSSTAWVRVVDRLLASPAYGERWARHWLDVVRYADARDLIQLPVESDFREAWRYRDWVVEAHNRDLPYPEFIRSQIAGDLRQPADPAQLDAGALVATGLLALADFVPGDVDKEQMVADYVNDQIDVVGRSFLGLTLGCARCHDHKFDPISTEDYYALAGIFFSTRLIPGPVPGNTPLVRVPLLPRAVVERIAADKQHVTELERKQTELQQAADREYLLSLEQSVAEQSAAYLSACREFRTAQARTPDLTPARFASVQELHPGILTHWLEYLGWSATNVAATASPRVSVSTNAALVAWRRQAEAGDPSQEARELSAALGELRKQRADEWARESGEANAPLRSMQAKLQANDPGLATAPDGRVSFWPNRARSTTRFATVAADVKGPFLTNVTVNDRARAVLRFAGQELLELPQPASSAGTLFLVYRAADPAASGQRVVGWEDSDTGRHGLGLMLTPGGGLHAIVRQDGANGDTVAPGSTNSTAFESVCLTWGKSGTRLYRSGQRLGTNGAVTGISADPGIKSLRIGGPGSGAAARFQGDLAEIRLYDQPLEDDARVAVEQELTDRWLNPQGPEPPPRSSLAVLYDELVSPRGPFWLPASERTGLPPSAFSAQLARIGTELTALQNSLPTNVPQAVVVQDGGPVGMKHEGFKDAQVYLRGNPKNPGKTVPRGFPRVLAGAHRAAITEGSGRLRLAEWIASPDNPLTARVAVNRIWQHHFGEGLVRTSTNFGQRGERPTHPELLDYLAARFIESGWSTKAMHRLMVLSSAYQQGSEPAVMTRTADPENFLLGRMNRMRLDAESLRDSLLQVAGRLDLNPGGAGFQDVALPRRSLYLMSVRTGARSGFASVFDAPDCGAVVERRSVSTVAPQALFLLNDPFTTDVARALAGRVAREAATPGVDDQIRQAYRVVFGRVPSGAEIAVGRQVLATGDADNRLERYCQVLLCANEFVYVD